MQAPDQLRLLLSMSSIPLEIPPRLTELQKAAKEFNWPDGPQAFVAIRNRLVHPPKTKGRQGRTWPYFEAYVLGKWYLDLVNLSAFTQIGPKSLAGSVKLSVCRGLAEMGWP